MATLRKDGSPRLSATEFEIRDGRIRIGLMGGSLKLRDACRDPRAATHSPTPLTDD